MQNDIAEGQSGGGLSDWVLAAFGRHRLVALGEAHDSQEEHDLLHTLISDPRLPGVVNDIVVEFGNALYQDTIDKFVLGGEPVNDADLRLVWRNTTQSPHATWDDPVYEQFFRRVRAVNWTLPADKRIRVLLGDPPFDWSTVTSASQIPRRRDSHAASLVEQQVLAKGRRALVCYGAYHLFRARRRVGLPPNLTSMVEQQTGARACVILPLLPMSTDPGGVFTRLADYPRGSVVPAADTWLGRVEAQYILNGVTLNGTFCNPYTGIPLVEIVDAGLYLGQAAEMTSSWPNPAIYLDPRYWAELQRRNTIQGNGAELGTYRQQQPPAYPLRALAPNRPRPAARGHRA
jgi:hypothetical protein